MEFQIKCFLFFEAFELEFLRDKIMHNIANKRDKKSFSLLSDFISYIINIQISFDFNLIQENAEYFAGYLIPK